jgi:site-specific recombinase XerD
MTSAAPIIEGFFTQRLAQQRVSSHTVIAYRDCLRLLLRFADHRRGKTPSQLDLSDLDADLISAFLEHLEHDRHNGIETCNLRLAAIHALFRYAQLRCPEHAALIARVLAIPAKRPDHNIVSYLTQAETDALLAAPDRTTLLGCRDHLLMLVAVQTGLRVSELTGLDCRDATFGAGANLYTKGKGRRQRRTPLTQPTARLLHDWIKHRRAGPDDPVFQTRTGGRLSSDAVEDLIDKYVTVAGRYCPSLLDKNVTPHTLRHTCAMGLLAAGFDVVTIALWLGHSSSKTTEIYTHADMTLKEKALARTAPTPAARHRYRPTDKLLAFLESL